MLSFLHDNTNKNKIKKLIFFYQNRNNFLECEISLKFSAVGTLLKYFILPRLSSNYTRNIYIKILFFYTRYCRNF